MQKASFQLPLFTPRELTYKECKNVNELSQLFCDRLNPSRKEIGKPPYTVPYMNKILQHLDLHDRKMFFASCEGAKNFGAFFHYSLKV